MKCVNCEKVLAENSLYCGNCGFQVSCKECKNILGKNENFCTGCGASIQPKSSVGAVNKIKFNETSSERSYEVAFTDEVGKEVTDLLKGMLQTRLSSGNSQFSESTERLISLDVKQSEDYIEEIKGKSNGENNEQYPHINDLVNVVNGTEADWILLFAFYSSEYGYGTFSKDQVDILYKENRYTPDRSKNFSTNWKKLFSNRYISTVKENTFKFESAGNSKIKKILNGEDVKSKPTNRTVAKGKEGKKTHAKEIDTEKFDAHGNDIIPSLEKFYEEKNPGKSSTTRILVFAYYVQIIAGQKYFTEGNIDYAYRVLHIKDRPAHLAQTITNQKNSADWFDRSEVDGKKVWTVTRTGQIFVESKLPKSNS